MYQTLVLGLGILLLVGVGYFIQHTDSQGVISHSIEVTASSSSATAKQNTAPGTYLCDSENGCTNPRTLSIYEDGTLKLSTSFDNGVEVLDEAGTWKIENEGMMTIRITETATNVYQNPRTLQVKYISGTTLSGLSYDESQFKDLKNPVFIRQGDQQ